MLILEEKSDRVTILNITTHYENKSEMIQAKYFIINDWEQAGLNKPSYIDTNGTVNLPPSAVDNHIGRLTKTDEMRLIEFLNK